MFSILRKREVSEMKPNDALNLAISHFEERANADMRQVAQLETPDAAAAQLTTAEGYRRSAAWQQSIADALRKINPISGMLILTDGGV